jgi:carbon monoxide dehydrogenase subunit G
MQIEESIVINADADRVWRIVENVGELADWVPAIAESSLDGEIRNATFAAGGSARERIIEINAAERYYTYEYLEGALPLAKYESKLAVTKSAEGRSTATWSADFTAGSAEEEAALATAISGIYSDALAQLADHATR